ncbi:hypothetical protein BD413DRAFT_190390 [Trametes elegans]|nr:hypothetical protein BD413DRAFT_190390 [Trametes elegans]
MSEAQVQNRKITHRTGFLIKRPALRRYLEEGLGLSCPPDGDFLPDSVPTGEGIDIEAMLAQMSSSLFESERRGNRFTDEALAHYDYMRREAAPELRTRLVRLSAFKRHWEYGPTGAELESYEQWDVFVPAGCRQAGDEDAELPTLLWDAEPTIYEDRRLQIFIQATTELIQHTTKRGRFDTEDFTFIAIRPENVYEDVTYDVQDLTDLLHSPDLVKLYGMSPQWLLRGHNWKLIAGDLNMPMKDLLELMKSTSEAARALWQ